MFNLKNCPNKIRAALSDSDFRAYTNVADDQVEILIMDEIGENWFGEGVTAESVVATLNQNRGLPVNVRINSPGGSVFEGLVIYNGLKTHDGKVTVTIEGLAFSAASFIAMAGDKIEMHEASNIGIHRAMGGVMGNAKAMRGVAEWLDKIDENLIGIYTARTGQDDSQVIEWIDGTDDGTMFTAKEAVEAGFADSVIENKQNPKTAARATVEATNRAILAKIRSRYRLTV